MTGQRIVLSKGLASLAGVAYLSILFIAGLLTNFIPLGTINTGTVTLLSLGAFLSFAGVLCLFGPVPKHITVAAFSILILSCLTLFKTVFDVNSATQRAQELVILFLGVWPFLFFVQIDNPEVRSRFLKVLSIGLLLLCIFGIFQSIFADSLPQTLFVLRGDNVFSIDDNQISRPTGLTGNPIIFASILVFASAYFLSGWLETHDMKLLFALICSLIANYLTYTRASFILVIPVLVLVGLLHKRFRVKYKFAALIVVLLAIAVGQFVLAKSSDLVMIQRLQQTDGGATIGSTIEHINQVQNAMNAIAMHPLAGTGMGSQSTVDPNHALVTDGAWWILLLEFGIPLSLLIIGVLFCILLIPLTKHILSPITRDRTLGIAILAFHAYIIPASFINSGLLGHVPFGLYWAVLGLSLADTNGRERALSLKVHSFMS